MKSFNLLTPINGVDDWNFKENEVSFFFFFTDVNCNTRH